MEIKKIYISTLLLLSLTCLAQAPANYYNAASGTGYSLKTQLYNIIKGHTDKGYAGLYTTYNTSDRDYFYEDDGSVLDMYSENPLGTDPYNYTPGNNQCGSYSIEGDCYNREHIVPQSVFNEDAPMKSDAHFITPTDGKVNGMRNNYPHGKVGPTSSYTSSNGSKLGQASNSGYAAGYSGIVFEPIDEFKGDIARMYFYFATRYQNEITSWGVSYPMFNGTATQVFTDTFRNILLEWNQMDPVSAFEVARNNAIYARQGNRNPFIDDNSYVTMIWGNALSAETFDAFSSLVIYPNPSRNQRVTIGSQTQLDEIELFSINGQLLQRIEKPEPLGGTYAIGDLKQGLYLLKLSVGNQTVTKKIIVE